MIIFNEIEYVENLLRTKNFTKKKRYELQLIAIYYYNKGIKGEELSNLLNNLCFKCFKNYIPNSSMSIKMIESLINNASILNFKDRKEINITKNEIDTILKEDKLKCRKIMFVYLVLAKYYYNLNNSSKYYVSCSDNDIFKLCKMYIKKQDKLDYMHYLTKKGYITPTLNMSSIVNYVNENSEIIMKFIPDDDMVYYLERYLGGNFIKCKICGKLSKKTIHNKKYCNVCAPKIKNDFQKATVP